MPRQPRLVREHPNVENTIPLALFRAQYPARYSLPDDDKFVLHAGASNYALEILAPAPASTLHVATQLHGLVSSSVSLFVLNTCLIIWSNHSEVGVEVPYTQIALHALKEVSGELVLYLQLLSSDLFQVQAPSSEFTSTVELVIRETAATDVVFPLLTENVSLPQLYDALSTCSAMHYDTESASEDELDEFDDNHRWFTADSEKQPQLEVPAHWINAGDADDLGMESGSEEEGEAGMNVNLGMGQIAGTVRRRNSQSQDAPKLRKLA